MWCVVVVPEYKLFKKSNKPTDNAADTTINV